MAQPPWQPSWRQWRAFTSLAAVALLALAATVLTPPGSVLTGLPRVQVTVLSVEADRSAAGQARDDELRANAVPFLFAGGEEELVEAVPQAVGTTTSAQQIVAQAKPRHAERFTETPKHTKAPQAVKVEAVKVEAAYFYLGCFAEARDLLTFGLDLGSSMESTPRTFKHRALTSGANPETCCASCSGFAYFALQYGRECYCGNGPGFGEQKAESECYKPCSSQAATMCGAKWRNSIYRIDRAEPSQAPQAPTTSPTPALPAATAVEPAVYVYAAAALREPEHWEDAKVPATKPAALTTVLTHVEKDELRLLASLALFMPGATLYVACTTKMVSTFAAATFSKPRLRLAPILDEFHEGNRRDLTKAGKWVSFNAKRIDILRLALLEGHDGAWYMDGDTFILAPLPRIDAPVGLSRHHLNARAEKKFGLWNSGYAFFRSLHALKTWDEASKQMERLDALKTDHISIHQHTLIAVAEKHRSTFVELGCSINIGKFRMMPGSSENLEANFDKVICSHGEVQYRNCTFISGHWHAYDKDIRKFMEKALRECHNPMLEPWLQSYR